MLKIKSLPDLKKYLETRKQLASGQRRIVPGTNGVGTAHIRGMEFAFEEAIKAVEALMQYEESRDNPDNWLESEEGAK